MGGERVGAANWQSRTLHRGCRHPQKTPVTSVEGSGTSIGSLDPKSSGDPESESLCLTEQITRGQLS
ncbi:hypothetical protein CRG98_008115 [Punica granatum]|uniref:Uncharacterized protein n=1 Tax=Punica granatum TaxID=22663 RepID=A0A2I0KSI4_PUNGR|nr:hypothetical protein CRG98_008115 [Punica granatum]